MLFRPKIENYVSDDQMQCILRSMIEQVEIVLDRRARGYYLITNELRKALPRLPKTGMVNFFIRHTSAGLTINENADPSVRVDFESYFNHMVPEGMSFVTHDIEGPDDMPAHIKSSIVGCSVTIPIKEHRMMLGTWQGIYLCEFRDHPHTRRVIATIYS